MAPSTDEGTGYAQESGSNFEVSNYSDEATERSSKIRKLLKNHKSEKLSSKFGAEAQMLQCYKDDLNLKRKMIENMEASEENFKERISKVNKTIEGIGTAITQSVQLLSELVKVRQNPAPRQYPQEFFQNMNPYITNQNGLASSPLNYASYAAGSNFLTLFCYIQEALYVILYTFFYLQKDKKATQNILQIFFKFFFLFLASTRFWW